MLKEKFCQNFMPSDRMREKITNHVEIFGEGGNAEKCVHYVENTPEYAGISTVNKIDKAFQMYQITVKQIAP